jgi:hypothetical protein
MSRRLVQSLSFLITQLFNKLALQVK